MALRRNMKAPAAEQVQAAPAAPAAEQVQAAPSAELLPAVAPAPAAAPAPAIAPSGLGEPIPPNGLLYDGLRNKFIPKFGTMPRLKVTNGNFMDQDKVVLGSWIEFQILSFNDIYVIGPCDGSAPKTTVKYSYDNIVLNDGTGVSVDDWLSDLRTAGWSKAASRKYMDLVVMLRNSERPYAQVGKIMSVQLPPTSADSFDGFRGNTTFELMMGMQSLNMENPYLLRGTTQLVTAEQNTWTKVIFTGAK